MALKTVQWSNRGEKLSCAGATPSDIIICLKDGALLLNPLPPVGDIPCAFLDATICQYFALQSCPSIWLYTFQYDDAQLADVNVPITCDDITGVFCRDCLTDWIECHFGEPSTICVEDTNTLNLSISEETGCIFGDVLISADDGNIIEARDDGLYGRQLLCVEDTTSINFEVTEDNCITGAVKVSADGGNIISIHADGIFAAGGGGGGNDWHILGNSDIVDGTNYLGTSNNVAVDFRQNNERVFRFQAGASSKKQSIIGGPDNNIITTSNNSFIGCGASNELSAILSSGINIASSIVGGDTNLIQDTSYCIIGGGLFNLIQSNVALAPTHPNRSLECGILAGSGNEIHGCSFSTIVAGTSNTIKFTEDVLTHYLFSSFIGAGQDNLIDSSSGSFIGAGEDNQIIGPGDLNGNTVGNSIVGGTDNTITDVTHSFIGGGFENSITDIAGSFSCNIIATGYQNEITGNDGFNFGNFIGSGYDNIITFGEDGSSYICSILGGQHNLIDETEQGSVICGGEGNYLTGTGVDNVICGGSFNQITSTSGGGLNVICGGDSNDIAGSSGGCTIAGGVDNNILFNSNVTTILGGQQLTLGTESIGYQGYIDFSPGNPNKFLQTDLTAFPQIGFFGDVDLWLGNRDGVARKFKFFEPNTDVDYSSTNFSSFRAQAQSADIDYIWPAAAGIAGQQLTIDTVVGTTVTLKWA